MPKAGLELRQNENGGRVSRKAKLHRQLWINDRSKISAKGAFPAQVGSRNENS
jgi:hypothetical protein